MSDPLPKPGDGIERPRPKSVVGTKPEVGKLRPPEGAKKLDLLDVVGSSDFLARGDNSSPASLKGLASPSSPSFFPSSSFFWESGRVGAFPGNAPQTSQNVTIVLVNNIP